MKTRPKRRPATPRAAASRPPLRTSLVFAILCGLILIAYSNSFSAGFALDSKQLILNDSRVHATTAENLALIARHSYWWPYGESGLYRPVTTLSYLFNYAILDHRDRPAGYHFFNLAVHAVNVLLVFVLTRRLTGNWPASLATAALWSVLPLSTEAVTNIVGRSDLLAALAVLAGFLLYLNSRESSGRQRAYYLAGLAAVTLLGVFAKESAVAIALVIGVYEALCWTPHRSREALVRAGLVLGPVLLFMWWQRSSVLGASPPAEFLFVDNPIVGASFVEGRLTALNVMARYLSLLVWPATLSIDYSYAEIPLAQGSLSDWLTALAFVLLIAAGFFIRKRRPALVFFAAFALVTFLPASNLLFPTGTILAERLMYLPSMGLAAVFCLALFEGARAVKEGGTLVPPYVLNALIALIVVAFAGRTWIRNADWKDDVTLWSAAVMASPNSVKAHRGLAEALYDSDPSHANIDRVIDAAERSVTLIAPLPNELSQFQIYRRAAGYHLDKATKPSYDRALELLERGLEIINTSNAYGQGDNRQNLADARRLLAAAYLGLDDGGPALEAALEARQLAPEHSLAHRLTVRALAANKRHEEAAVALMVGSMMTAEPAFRQELLGLYQSADAGGCAVTNTPKGTTLNPKCPLVRRHLCAATMDAVGFNVQLGRMDQAERLSSATTELGCGAER